MLRQDQDTQTIDSYPTMLGGNFLSTTSNEHIFMSAFNNAACGMAVVSHEGNWLNVNKAFCRLLGYRKEELLNKSFHDITHPDDLAEEEQFLPLMAANKTRNFQKEKRYIHKNGSTVWALLSVSSVYDEDGNIPFVINQIFDITPRKKIEFELLKAKEEAILANKAKSHFLSRMSHELRTPLNAILGFAELLNLTVDESSQAYSNQIHKAGKHLLDLINEVLEIARIESGGMSLSMEVTQADSLIEESMNLLAPLAAKHNITLEHTLTDTCTVNADPQRLKQIMINLLSNAVKYNSKGGRVFVRTKQTAGYVSIEVQDEGKGIASEHLHDIFLPFNRLGAEQTNIEGTGIGLTLTKHLVEAMGGSITVKSEVGQGSSFEVKLRCAQEAPELVAQNESSLGSPFIESRNINIVYVEDNISNRGLMNSIMNRVPDMHLSMANDGTEGLELIRLSLPDVVLLDLHMPGLSGEDVLKALKADPVTADIPVVIVSADATPIRIQELKESGASAYLTKPIEVRDLLNTIKEITSKS